MEYRYRRDEDDDEESSSEEESGNNNSNSGRPYECMFCRRGFTTAQALGGHMNIHRKDRASANNNNKPITSFGSSASTTKHDTSSTDHLDHLAFYSPIPTPISVNNNIPPPSNSSSSNYSHRAVLPTSTTTTTPSHLQYSRLLQCVQQNQHNFQDHQDDGLDLELRLGYHHHRRHHP